MITKRILAFVCLVCIGIGHHVAEGRTLSLYDLVPATPIKSKPASHLALGGPPIFHNCSKATDKFQLQNVLVAGCSTPPCELIKGSNASVEIDFISHEDTPKITAKVYGQIAGVMVPFPLTNPDGCTSGVQCPTKVGTAYKYKYSLPISSRYKSGITLAVFWYLEDVSGEALCMDVAVTIKDPSNKIE